MDASFGPSTVIFDVRCLQDPDYARRGIGRFALALLRHAPRHLQVLGLQDTDLPPLLDEAREALSGVVLNSYAAMAALPVTGQCFFVEPSPMTHDPLFVARIVSQERMRCVAVVHDFIPHRKPEYYLPDPAARLSYANSLRWLARYDAFATNSQSTANELLALLRVPASAVVVAGAPVDPIFEGVGKAQTAQHPKHVLVVGGGDPRKNPEVAVRAHARSAAMQAGAGIPLLIAGTYGPAEADRFRALAAELGGRGELVQVPGHVPEAALREIYARALMIICPSRDEGFSLPIVEGMAAGIPCLASDIPAQRELVHDPELRFAPDDDAKLLAALDHLARDEARRAAIVAQQAKAWPRFRGEEVGRRFWGFVLQRAGANTIRTPSISYGRRPRLALLSPLPPDRSGIADYTGAACGPLGELVDLHVFTETQRPDAVAGAASVRPLTALPHLMPGFDRVVSVIGNSHFHLRIFELLRRYGGACIAHDARMLGFYRILMGQDRALSVASQELKRPVNEPELNGWLADEGRLEALFLGEIAESAAPMIVHSRVTAQLMQERFGVAPAYLPFSIYRPWSAAELAPAARAAARARLGFAEGEVVIATFGYVHVSKAPEECVWALELLRGWGVPASLHFVGGMGDAPGNIATLQALVARLGLTSQVRFGGDYVSEETYRDYLVAADLAVQLRTYGLGGLSGALLDCAAAGLPTVTNQALGQAVGVPMSYVRCIPDAPSPVLPAEALADLLQSSMTASQREMERQAYSDERSFAVYARRLCEVLELDVAGMGRSVRAVA